MENNCLGIVVFHINRQADELNKGEPNLYNPKDSSKIEELANKVLVLWCDEDSDSTSSTKLIHWKYAKDREGFGGCGNFILDKSNLTITEVL